MVPSPLPRGLILLADDDVNIRNIVRTILEYADFSALVAADGAEALELSRAHGGTIDLLLTDVEMPHLDGISLYREILAERPEIKVIFMSGGLAQKLALPPSLAFLAKPFKGPALIAKLNELLAVTPPASPDLKVILLVDQNEERQARTNRILVDDGYAVLVATSAEEAEGLVNSLKKIDLIISEVVLSGETGVRLAERAEASDRKLNTLLISHFHKDTLQSVAGFAQQPEFLSNPFTPEELLTRVHELLP